MEIHLTPDSVRQLERKMLIITSENDSGVSPTAFKSLKNLYANAKFFHFTEGGHSPLLVKQKEYIKLVREHLQ